MKSLYNGDTKHEVLSEVTQMNLEDTVAFVEASVIGSAKDDRNHRASDAAVTTGRTEDILKHLTQPVLSAARLDITPGSARSLVINKPKKRR